MSNASQPSEIAALVINLASASERWDFQQKQLDTLAIQYERHAATSVADLSIDDYEKWANDWQRKLRKSEVACFLSHYRAWKLVAETQTTRLILEDDALLSDQLPSLLATLATQSSALPFTHLTLETRGRKKLIGDTLLLTVNDVEVRELFLDRTGAAAYILTPTGAATLLQAVAQQGAGLADALLCHTDGLKSAQTVPALALQMDMAAHYGLQELLQNTLASTTISHSDKPKANSFNDLLNFKYRRLSAQATMGAKKLKYKAQAINTELHPDPAQFSYLQRLLIGSDS